MCEPLYCRKEKEEKDYEVYKKTNNVESNNRKIKARFAGGMWHGVARRGPPLVVKASEFHGFWEIAGEGSMANEPRGMPAVVACPTVVTGVGDKAG
jgi:hypothetical protein